MAKDKKGIALIISGLKKRPGMDGGDQEEEKQEGEAGTDEHEKMLAEEVMGAMKSGDTEGFADALRAFVHNCTESY